MAIGSNQQIQKKIQAHK